MKTLIESSGLIAATMLLTSGLAHAASGLAPSQNPFATGTTQAPSDVRVAQRSQVGYGPQTFQSLGRRNMAEGDIESAERRFAEALEINPFDPVALNNLAAAKAEQGDYQTLQRTSQVVYEMYPESGDDADSDPEDDTRC